MRRMRKRRKRRMNKGRRGRGLNMKVIGSKINSMVMV